MYDPVKPYKKQILELIKRTWETPYVSIKEGAYPVIKKKFSYLEVDHTDGIGTKGIYHWQQGTFKNAVLDALAMNLNDLAIMGATPYKLQNHITAPEEDERIIEIIKVLSQECQKRNIPIAGGENSFHDNSKGLDISITVSGFIKNLRSNEFKSYDLLIGIESNGLHSNGFTKVRKVFGKEYRDEFVKPTNIYLDTISAFNEKFNIHGMIHITGGAFSKLKDLLGNTDALIIRNHQLKPQAIFQELYQKGISDEEMYKTFNCGIGFILSVDPKDVKNILSEIKDFKAGIIGKVIPGTGKVKIESSFSNKEITF